MPHLPSFVTWNIRSLNLSAGHKLKMKIANCNRLCEAHDISVFSETHATNQQAKSFFFDSLSGSFTDLYANDVVFILKKGWADTKTHLRLRELIPQKIQILTWSEPRQNSDDHAARTCHFIHFHLDSHNDSARTNELGELTRWIRDNVNEDDHVFFAGDRNFSFQDQRSSSTSSSNGVSEALREAWQAFLNQIRGREISQPEFTFKREYTTAQGDPGWCHAVLDVVGTNVESTSARAASQPLHPRARLAVARLPHPDVSDHYPVELVWADLRRHKRRNSRGRDSEAVFTRTPLPEWPLSNANFVAKLQAEGKHWFDIHHDLQGGEALTEFTAFIHQFTTEYLTRHIVGATTTRHKFSATIALLTRLTHHEHTPCPFTFLTKLGRVYPLLNSLVEIEIDAHSEQFRVGDLGPLRAHAEALCIQLQQEDAGASEPSPNVDGPSHIEPTSLNSHSPPDPPLLTKLKKLKQPARHTLGGLFDDRTQEYTDDPEEMSEIIQRAALLLQGHKRGDKRKGADLLRNWGVDLSDMRTQLLDDEIERIILDAPRHKHPGPDGVPAAYFRLFARALVPLFQEAWSELGNRTFTARVGLGRRTWKVIPKEENATTTARLRDLELCNEWRKVLARMTNLVMDEICSQRLSAAQQAFMSGRHITRNNVGIHHVFRLAVDAHRRSSPQLEGLEHCSDTTPLLLLLLDCSKGYNAMSWEWLERCMATAAMPTEIRNVVHYFLHTNEAVLTIQGHEFEPLRYVSGLPQGCPLSCFLYILGVDPLLRALEREAGVERASGFVDDWGAACRGFYALHRVMDIVNDFELASGQIVNFSKSKVLPSRRLTDYEIRQVRSLPQWRHIEIRTAERLLGLQIGIDATIESQYARPLQKLDDALAIFEQVRHETSITTRVAIANVFLVSLFSYVNQHFIMPAEIVKVVQRKISTFISRYSFWEIGFLPHVGSFYGITVTLRDLRWTNVAAVLHTYSDPEIQRLLLEHPFETVLPTSRDDANAKLRQPLYSYKVARDIYEGVCHRTPEDTLRSVERQRQGQERNAPKIGSAIYYADLLLCERPRWRRYFANRVRARGYNFESLMEGLGALPRSVSQKQRWFLLKVHFNALATSARYRFSRSGDPPLPCPFCAQGAGDDWHHIPGCGHVLHAMAQVHDTAPAGTPNWTWRDLFFQRASPSPISERVAFYTLTLAFYAAVEHFRRSFAGRPDLRPSATQLASLVEQALDCPWLTGNQASADRAERRRARVRPPPRLPHAQQTAIYTSDGNSRWTRNRREAACGCAYWAPGADTDDSPTATYGDYLPDATNNEAEYEGLECNMARALRRRHLRVLFRVDSMLVKQQVNGPLAGAWACRSEHLLPRFRRCVALGRRLDALGIPWSVEHIYREYNVVADSIANAVIDGVRAPGPSVVW